MRQEVFIVEPTEAGFLALVVFPNGLVGKAVSQDGVVTFGGEAPQAFKTYQDAKNVLGIMKRDLKRKER